MCNIDGCNKKNVRKQEMISVQKRPCVYKLAKKLHDSCCPYNHIDGCFWQYEEDANNWNGEAHQKWLQKARNILAVTQDKLSTDEIIKIINMSH